MRLRDRLAHGFELLLVVEVERMNPTNFLLHAQDVIGNRFASFSVEARRISRDDIQNVFEFFAGLVALAFEFTGKFTIVCVS